MSMLFQTISGGKGMQLLTIQPFYFTLYTKIISVTHENYLQQLTSQNKRPNTRYKARQKRIEWKRSNQETIAKLNNASKHNVQ